MQCLRWFILQIRIMSHRDCKNQKDKTKTCKKVGSETKNSVSQISQMFKHMYAFLVIGYQFKETHIHKNNYNLK